LPHAGQIALAAELTGAAGAAAGAGAGCGAGLPIASPCSGPASAATVDAWPRFPDGCGDATGAGRASEVPHILQKFIPGGFTVPHALHVFPPAGVAGLAGAAASRRWPQSWQNSDPSRFTLPQ
jgi:hypothetical protein